MLSTFSTYVRLIAAGLRSHMQYRADFLVEITGVTIQYSAQLLNLNIIVNRFEGIGGWGLYELVFLYGLAVLAIGIAQMLFTHFVELGDILLKGEFDRYLIRPVNPFVLYLGSHVSAGNIGHMLFASVIFGWAVSKVMIDWTVLKVFYLALTILGGALIHGSFIVLVGTLSFWFQRTGTMFWTVVVPSREMIFYPVSILPKVLQVVLTFVIPFAFINFYPAHALLGRSGVLFHPLLAWITPAVGLLCFAGVYWVWSFGTRRYSGAGS